jgi:fatty-acyl-CoA synthase
MLNYSTDAISGMGACGRVGPILAIAFKSMIVKFDVATEMPLRTDGRCIPCSPGEVGELLVFVDPSMSLKRYDGYLNNDSANSKKILRNVVKTGDHYFRTGDLFREVDGYQYFVDRIGDTFRWKVSILSNNERARMFLLWKYLTHFLCFQEFKRCVYMG